MTCRRQFRSALLGEKGSATVEFVMWLPIFLLLFSAVTDVSLLLSMQSRMFDVARDSSRLVSLGRMTEAEADEIVAILVPLIKTFLAEKP